MAGTRGIGNSKTRRAIVIGGSVSGLMCGLLLRQTGWQVDVYERVATELSGRGAGIVAQPELIERLRTLGFETEQLGVNVATRKLFDRSGVVTATHECPQVVTAWERVYRELRDHFPTEHYHRGKGVETFTQTDCSVSTRFSDGSTAEAELLVGADGIRSTIRQLCAPDATPRYAGYIAWRALVPENAFPPDIHDELFAYMSFCLPPGEQFLGYPVAGPDNALAPGHRRYNVVWYRPAGEQTDLQWLLTDDRGVKHPISIPPPLIRREAIAQMRKAAERLLAPQMHAVVRLIQEPILQPIYDLETPHMAFGRVAILGDAAFVARPHVAAGVAKAADDASALVRALTECGEVEPGLQRFEQERLPINRRFIERARHLGAYLQAHRDTAEERALSERYSIPEAVIRETAVLDFMYA